MAVTCLENLLFSRTEMEPSTSSICLLSPLQRHLEMDIGVHLLFQHWGHSSRRSGVQGPLWVDNELEACMGSVKPCINFSNNIRGV